MASGMKRISTHILDLALGKPAPDVPVRLERQEASGGWHLLASAQTDRDGRCSQLLPETEDLSDGLYRLGFDTASDYASQKTETLFRVVGVTFRVTQGESQSHVALLLSPDGYRASRGC